MVSILLTLSRSGWYHLNSGRYLHHVGHRLVIGPTYGSLVLLDVEAEEKNEDDHDDESDHATSLLVLIVSHLISLISATTMLSRMTTKQ